VPFKTPASDWLTFLEKSLHRYPNFDFPVSWFLI
jgi:hypothetical protein